MTATTLTRPAETTTVPSAAMTAKEAFELKKTLREQGWQPLESSRDFRNAAVGANMAGQERTIAYFPEFRALFRGPSGWSCAGRPQVPAEASFVEVYAVSVVGSSVAWAPVA